MFLLFLLLVLTAACGPGCLKLMQKQSENPVTTATPGPDPGKADAVVLNEPAALPADLPDEVDPWGNPIDPVVRQVPAAVPTTSRIPGFVSEALPETTPDPYPAPHSVRFNSTPEMARSMGTADFTRTYVLRGNSTGLIINATTLNGPLWISFDVKPVYDCLNNPGTCRGDVKKTVTRPYFTITVRNNETRGIVTEDGYGREFSSEKTNRSIKVYGEGWYHLTLTGNYVDVTLSVSTGTAPALPATQSPAASSAQEADGPSEMELLMRGG